VSCCPSGEYCQPWNPSYYQCRPSPQQCAPHEVGVDYYGADIKTIESIFPADCCSRCAETLGCTAYTFVNYNANGKSACYLKTGTGAKQAKVGAVSATVLKPKQSACGISVNTDFYGNDLWTEVGLTAEQCCDKCRATAGCKAFTHANEPTRAACYLKKAAANNKYYWGATSGVVN
jgi:glucan 1,3-beta-glucosidase